MRIVYFITAAAMVLAGPLAAQAPAPAPAPDRYALAQEVMALVLPEKQREGMMRAVMTSSIKNISGAVSKGLEGQELTDAQRQFVAKFVERQALSAQDLTIEMLPALLDAMAKAYARQFSLAELRDMKAFFASPTGRSYIAKAPLIMADPDVAAVQAELMQKSMARLPAEMEALKAELKKGNKP